MQTYVDVRELRKAHQAGIFDGEGYCCAKTDHSGLQVGVAQANYPFCESFRDEYGGSLQAVGDVWKWQLGGAPDQLVFLRAITPYLVLRNKEVAIAIEICKLVPVRGRHITPKEALLRERLFILLKDASIVRRFGYREKIA